MQFWALIIILLLFLLMFYVNKNLINLHYSILNPINVMIGVWGSVFICHYCVFEYHPYTLKAYFWVALTIILFAFGFWFGKRICFKKERNINKLLKYNLNNMLPLLKVLTIFEIIRIIFVSMIVYKLANGSLSNIFLDSSRIRMLYLAREGSIVENMLTMFLTLNSLVGFVFVGIYKAYKGRNSNKIMFLWIILELWGGIVTMSKMSFFIGLSVIFSSYINKTKEVGLQSKILKKIIPSVSVLVIVLLVFIGIQRGYGSTEHSLMNVVFKQVMFYYSSPLEAFSIKIKNYSFDASPENGCFMFRFVKKILVKMGLLEEAITRHGNIVETDQGVTNVYTWLNYFYDSYSYPGLVFMPCFFGILIGFFYKYNRDDIFTDISYAWLTSALFISFYTYLLGQTTYMIVFFYGFLLKCFFSRKLLCS